MSRTGWATGGRDGIACAKVGNVRRLVRIEPVSWFDLPDHDQQVVQAIYEAVFPARERRPLDLVMASPARVWVARRDDRLVGFAVATVLGATGVGLLQYLAVTPPEQSVGIGSALLAELARDLPVDGVLLEVEPPSGEGASAQARRRLTFYERWGAQPLECLTDYFMGDFAEPGGRLPMLLLWKPVATIEPPKGGRLRAVLEAIFDSEYAAVAGPGHLADLLAKVRC